MIESGTAIPFQTEGKRFSHVPRDRELEQKNGTPENGRQFFEAMEKEGAWTAYYVIITNRNGASPDSSSVFIRQVFQNQGKIVQTIPLDGEDGAIFDLMGSTTAPYAVGEKETHFLFFVTKNGSVPTLGELNSEEVINYHKILGYTLDYLEMTNPPGSISYIGISTSPLESRRIAEVRDPITKQIEIILQPRSPVQNVGTLHAHVVTLQLEQLKSYPRSDKRFDERMLCEPRLEVLTEIFRTVVFDPVMEQFPDLFFQYAEHTESDNFFPKGSFLIIDRGELKNPRFAQLIQALHQQAERAYFRIADTTVVAENIYKGEVIMRDGHESKANLDELFREFPYFSLSHKAQRFIRSFGRMRDPNRMVSPDISFSERAKIAESFVLLGLAYNIVYYYPELDHTKAVVAIEPRWITGASTAETMGIFKDQIQTPTEEFRPIYQQNMEAARGLGLYISEKMVQSNL